MSNQLKENWEKEFDKRFLAKENKKMVIKTGLSTFWAENIKDFIRQLFFQEKQKERRKTIEMLERIKLEVDVGICDCGEKWIETDLADIVNGYLKELKNKKL